MRWVDLSRHNLAVWALRPRGLVVLPILEAHAMPGIDASTMGSLRAAGQAWCMILSDLVWLSV